MHDDFPQRPQLLVSVRSLDEARDAVAGGCDILDIKEPANGSLGMAETAVIREIIAAGTQGFSETPGFCPETPISAALGEARDWRDRHAVPVLPRGLRYVKLGTAGLARMANWERTWRSVRARFDAAAESPLQWVAVGYADWMRAAAPSPPEILQAAFAEGCAGFLLDTFVKDGRSLFDGLSPGAVTELLCAIRKTPQFIALAGNLSLDDLHIAAELRPDVIAVRSAACRDGLRNAPVCRDSVRRLREALDGLSAVPVASTPR